MKNLSKIVTLTLVVFSVVGFSQNGEEPKKENNKPKHEIRIIMENFLERQDVAEFYQIWNSSNFSNTGTYEYYNNKLRYGLGYNFNLNKIGFRSRIFYSSYKDTFFDSRKTETTSNGLMYRVSIGMNYQKSFDKIVLYVGADFSSFKNVFDQIQKNPIEWGGGNEINQSVKYFGYGIEPLVGFKYFFTNHFSVSSEIRFIIDSFDGETLVTYFNSVGTIGSNDEYLSTFDGRYTNLGPKGSISLNIHF